MYLHNDFIAFLINLRYYDPPMQYCSRNSTPIQFRISSDMCIKGSCGKFGRCYQFFSGGNMFSTCTCFAGKHSSVFLLFKLRFLYSRLALVIHCDSHLSSMTLPLQLLSFIKFVFFYQILIHRI